jgi:hypothetical protein
MTERILNFYEPLADHYHLIFDDWNKAIERQAKILDPLLAAQMHGRPLKILDCACGIGTQALGLAGFGHQVSRKSRFEEVYDAIPGPLYKPFRYQLTSRMVRLVDDKPSAKQRLRVSQSDRVPLDRIVTMHAAVSAAATSSRFLGRSANGVQ